MKKANNTPTNGCRIVAVGKRRDGGTRYWCLHHKADATAKYGRPAARCRYAHLPEVSAEETLVLRLEEYTGGVALWGAVPPVYDTSAQPLDRGIHVHARRGYEEKKALDKTFRAVRMVREGEEFVISELDAIYFMISSVFGHPLKQVVCTFCRYPHLDKDWFSVHPHRSHLCSGCGKHFRDSVTAVGNPICGLRDAMGLLPRPSVRVDRPLTLDQAKYPGGIQIWGSNPAIAWTGDRAEEEGIHVHAFDSTNAERPVVDDTFSSVCIDGVTLDPVMVRVLMAQNALPHLADRVAYLACRSCGTAHFKAGDGAVTPLVEHECTKCGETLLVRGRLRKVVGNPLINLLRQIAASAPRETQKHDLGLVPETL